MNLYDIAMAIAKEHIANHNAKLELLTLNVTKGSFWAIISHPSLNYNIEEAISTNGLPTEVAEEYMHCRIHGLAAKLISKLYPEQ